jgi:hypothetical protein
VSEELFANAQAHSDSMKREGKPIGGKPSVHNVLSKLARCPICDSTMTRINKGLKWKYYVCTKAKSKSGCKYTTVKFDLVNMAVLNSIGQLLEDKPSLSPTEDKLKSAIQVNEQELSLAYDKLENLLSLAEKGNSASILERILKIEAHIKSTKSELERLMSLFREIEKEMLDKRIENLIDTVNDNPVDTSKLNAVLHSIFSKVVIDYIKGNLSFYWKETGHISSVTYDYSKIF